MTWVYRDYCQIHFPNEILPVKGSAIGNIKCVVRLNALRPVVLERPERTANIRMAVIGSEVLNP